MTKSLKGSRQRRGLLGLILSVAAVILFCLSAPLMGSASAHAERTSSEPEESAKLDRSPAQLAINFSEPPTGDAVVEVADGCGNNVVSDVKVQNQDVTAQLAEGQPGKWKVNTTVVSGVDGHQTKDSWNFSVAGERDCSQAAADPQAPDDEDESGGDFPIVMVLGVAFGVLVLAVLLRVLTGRSAD